MVGGFAAGLTRTRLRIYGALASPLIRPSRTKHSRFPSSKPESSSFFFSQTVDWRVIARPGIIMTSRFPRAMPTLRSMPGCVSRHADRRADSSWNPWHPGVAARQGARAFHKMLARGGDGPAAGYLSLHRQQPRRSGAVAKRRLSAVTIGHLTPPLSAAGLHGAMAELRGAGRGICRRRGS